MTDIVERLDDRWVALSSASLDRGCLECGLAANDIMEAPDEIERLRKALREIRDWPSGAPKCASFEAQSGLDWAQDVATEALRHD